VLIDILNFSNNRQIFWIFVFIGDNNDIVIPAEAGIQKKIK